MNKKQKRLLLRIIIAAVFFVPLYLISEEYVKVDLPQWAVIILFLIPYLLVGYDILRKAFLGIRHGQVFDENFLMTVATVGAIVLGEYGEGVAVMLLYQVGELFQSYAVGKSRRNITELMDIRPDYANLEEDGELRRVDPDEVEVGSIIVVQPGEKVPLDGVVVEGSSSLNTSALTGESLPRKVEEGSEVLSGSINMSGVLKLRTTTEFDESTASKILDLVERRLPEIRIGELYLQVRPVLHPHRVLLRPGPGGPAPPVRDAHPCGHGSLRHPGQALGRLGPAGLHLPGDQLSLRRGHQHPPEFLRRAGRRQQAGRPGDGQQLPGDPEPGAHRGLR